MPDERRQDERVLLARVRLAGDQEAVARSPPPRRRAGRARSALSCVAVEERDEGRLRARRPLAAEEPQLLGAAHDLAMVEREVLQPQARALADRRRLRGLEVRVAEAGRSR